MKRTVTNRLGLPQAIVEAVQNDPYDGEGSDYTITGLLQPPRAAVLSKDAEVVEDAADMLYTLQGQVMHEILERAGDALKAQGFVVERRFFQNYIVDGRSFKTSAKIDIFNPMTGMLSDYKYTSVGSASRGLKEDHRLQLNFQAELLRKAGYTVVGAEVVLLLRDWSAERVYAGYPPSPACKHIVEFMSSQEIDAWAIERIRLHEAAKQSLPLCTKEERWNRTDYVVTGGRKRVFKTEREAQEYVASAGDPRLAVGERLGDDVRCLRYCPARSVCEHAKSLTKPLPIVDEGDMREVK